MITSGQKSPVELSLLHLEMFDLQGGPQSARGQPGTRIEDDICDRDDALDLDALYMDIGGEG